MIWSLRLHMMYMNSLEMLDLTYFNQETLSIIFKDADTRVVGTIQDSRKCCFPWCYPRAEKHCAYG